jgi:hypothetical protein
VHQEIIGAGQRPSRDAGEAGLMEAFWRHRRRRVIFARYRWLKLML